MLKIESSNGVADVDIDLSDYSKRLTFWEIQADLLVGVVEAIKLISQQTGKNEIYVKNAFLALLKEHMKEQVKKETTVKINT